MARLTRSLRWSVLEGLKATRLTTCLYADVSRPIQAIRLFEGGVFDSTYNHIHEPVRFRTPGGVDRVLIMSVITGKSICPESQSYLIHGTDLHQMGIYPIFKCLLRAAQHSTDCKGHDGCLYSMLIRVCCHQISNVTFTNLFEEGLSSIQLCVHLSKKMCGWISMSLATTVM